MIDSYASVNGGITLGLSVMRAHYSKREKIVPIFLEWDDVRLRLVERNTTLTDLGSRVATSRLGIPWTQD